MENLEQYKKRVKELDEAYKKDKDNLAVEYVKLNAKHKIGDIVSDHNCTIKIDKISVSIVFNETPEPVYSGIELEKDLTPKKGGIKNSIWERSIKK